MVKSRALNEGAASCDSLQSHRGQQQISVQEKGCAVVCPGNALGVLGEYPGAFAIELQVHHRPSQVGMCACVSPYQVIAGEVQWVVHVVLGVLAVLGNVLGRRWCRCAP